MLRALLIGILLVPLTAGADTPPEKGRPPDPKPDSGLPEAPGRQDISDAMQKVKPAIMACGAKHQVKGTIKIAIKVGPDGTVTSAEIKQSPDEKVNACVVGVAKTIVLPKSQKGVTFSYPIILG
jgi:hypothetical protein